MDFHNLETKENEHKQNTVPTVNKMNVNDYDLKDENYYHGQTK